VKKVVHYKAGPYLPVTENWIFRQIANLDSYQSTVYCHGTVNLDTFPVARIKDFGDGRLSNPYGFTNRVVNEVFGANPFVKRALRADRPDIVHAHFGQSGYFMSRTRGSARFGLVTTFYGADLSRLPHQKARWRRRYRRLFVDGDLFLLQGPNMRDTLISLGCPESKARVHRLGIDLGEIKSVPRTAGSDGVVKVLVASSFREKKGIPYAIEAFGLASKKRPDLKLSMTIIGDSGGTPEDEAEKAKILAAIDQFGLQDKVDMRGYRPWSYLIEQLYRHHIFVSPSVTAANGDTEGGVNVAIIEAMASGMPVLSTVHCDMPSLVLDGATGFLVAERDSAALAEKLLLLATDPSRWAAMGHSARRHVERDYDARKQGRELEAIYDEVVSETARRL